PPLPDGHALRRDRRTSRPLPPRTYRVRRRPSPLAYPHHQPATRRRRTRRLPGTRAGRKDGAGPMSDELLYEKRGHAACPTLNRPDRLNALNGNLKARIVAAAVEASVDPDVWVVVLRGAGGRAFCVGADLKDMQERDRAGARPATPMIEAERNL